VWNEAYFHFVSFDIEGLAQRDKGKVGNIDQLSE
jgi:hypothetical protein